LAEDGLKVGHAAGYGINARPALHASGPSTSSWTLCLPHVSPEVTWQNGCEPPRGRSRCCRRVWSHGGRIASRAGVARFDDESGRRRGARHIQGAAKRCDTCSRWRRCPPRSTVLTAFAKRLAGKLPRSSSWPACASCGRSSTPWQHRLEREDRLRHGKPNPFVRPEPRLSLRPDLPTVRLPRASAQ
jgi:hypothetical protein